MFKDFLTLILVNMSAGLALLACYVYWDIDGPGKKRWVPGFALSGLLAAITGLDVVFTWPLPGSFNIIFGEPTILFGLLMLMMAAAALYDLDLFPVAVYAAFAGVVSLLLGYQVLRLGLTKEPLLSGISFLWSGLIGVFAIPMLRFRKVPAFRIFGAGGLALAAALWAITGYGSYLGHVEPFMKWKPMAMQYQQEMQKPPPAAAPQAEKK